jgi:hypothetical protein
MNASEFEVGLKAVASTTETINAYCNCMQAVNAYLRSTGRTDAAVMEVGKLSIMGLREELEELQALRRGMRGGQ